LPLKHASLGNSAHGIQCAREGEDEREGDGKGEVHSSRVCLATPAWRKFRLT
jgi:hypothetical protein